MLLSQRRTRCREITGPTPHSVAVRARPPALRPAEQLMLQRQRQDAARDKVLEFSKYQQSCNIKTSWLKDTEQRFLKGAVERGVQAAVSQHETDVEQRRRRLAELLEVEEQQFLQEMEEKKETTLEKEAKMREKAKALRHKRESERQQLVSEKLEQQFREQCEELRSICSRLTEQQVSQERTAQVRSRQAQQRRQQEEDLLFSELWAGDGRAKEELEGARAQSRRHRNEEQRSILCRQMEAAEQQRQRERELKEEEARLLAQQRQTSLLQEQREQQQKLQAQQGQRRLLDHGLRLKMKRLAREQREELELDMSILQALLKQEIDEKQGAAQRKAELREEQRRYREYLFEELQRQRKEEEEMEQLIEEQLKEVWAKREEKSRLKREARKRLIEEVMEAQHLQIQNKLYANLQKQAQVKKECEELERVIEEENQKEEEEKRRQKQAAGAYQADLRAQMQQQQQLHSELKAQEQREHQQGLLLEQLLSTKKEHILSRFMSHSAGTHPFRRVEVSRSAPQTRLTDY
ncbi:cilia- and flagella-associated protein 53 [Maylandia zebra]|uniref:cilia- and flagella-associated protein 53 n=1 Tax=Maylandia zebra TaxID=106582 RepID=UPI000645AF57